MSFTCVPYQFIIDNISQNEKKKIYNHLWNTICGISSDALEFLTSLFVSFGIVDLYPISYVLYIQIKNILSKYGWQSVVF